MVLGLWLAFGMAAQAQTLDDFSQPTLWHAEGTDDVSTSLRSVDGKALCLAFDFQGVSGAATLRRTLPITFPDNFALSFDVRGTMAPNDLQLKLIDASGDNVWWFRREHFEPTATWQHIEVRRRDIEFAWGPGKDRTLRHTHGLEFTVYAGQGGKGELCVDNLKLAPLPTEPATAAPPKTPNALLLEQAAQAPRGLYPRGFSGEQSYWTLVGVDGGAKHSALLSEDGAVEVDKGGWSIEPLLFSDHEIIHWASVKTTQRLEDGYLPIPTVHWQADTLSLETTAFATGTPQRSQLLLRYVLHNDSDRPRQLTLALMTRPFQVNPPTQFLNTPGGISSIHDLYWDGHSLTVNGHTRVLPLQHTDAFVADGFDTRGYDAAALAQRLAGQRPTENTQRGASRLHDAQGFGQGAMLYRLELPAHGSRTVGLVVPWHEESMAAFDDTVSGDAAVWLQQQLVSTANLWRDKLNRVTLHLPRAQQAIADTARSALAQMLLSRDGPALQPGTRSYARSWVRDGAMMTEGLVRSGHAEVAAEFVRWYAPHQFSNGKVPCCVDARGSDPVPENDSHGEMIFAIAELWRYTHDRAELEKLWPTVARAVTYMDKLRESERSPANQTAERRALYGLMPASISHEGYSAKPMHSYWDDFWALQGYDDAVLLATALDKPDDAARIASARDTFRTDLQRSINAAMTQHGIDFLPGAAELGDFDATSTTIALSPNDGQTWLPPGLLERTFERYWQGFLQRRDGKTEWDDYTPYELRTIASFVRLGWRDRVEPLLTFFFAGRRPAAWNQWAEVVGRDLRKPRFVGDMPHAWIASDYLRSAYDLFAYERAGDHALVLAAGIPSTWLQGEGVGIERLRTPYGELGYTLREVGGKLELRVKKGLTPPPGGLVLPWPYADKPPGQAWLNGQPVAWRAREIVIRTVPATLNIER
ncbi:discoidin domain-containing protein [Dyella tabacisoli]|uniref:Discoidin domain-containing protein n=2 Tax=Dyella tabacisoli TaxID=2282381 RepID=A0A369UK51_9GAMM|nr:discoidin domain-containing protein [Dyella tabacisoli]